jgi:hypothetical protein
MLPLVQEDNNAGPVQDRPALFLEKRYEPDKLLWHTLPGNQIPVTTGPAVNDV